MNQIFPKAPLFRAPIFDGAADPTLIWNREEKTWWIVYTNRRANVPTHSVSFVHGTDIGICSSEDGGANWIYRGTIPNLEFEPGRNTFWAPEVIYENGLYHFYVSYIRGVPQNWEAPRSIVHYTGVSLWNLQFENVLALSSDRVIDPCVYKLGPNQWKMWYKDERNDAHTYAALSKDLHHWNVIGAEISDCMHEGPNVFSFGGFAWMITDPWEGLGVYRSTDFSHWIRRDNLLAVHGKRADDQRMGQHADIEVFGENAYIFYHTHPGLDDQNRQNNTFDWSYDERRSSLQVARLTVINGELRCDRDEIFELRLTEPAL